MVNLHSNDGKQARDCFLSENIYTVGVTIGKSLHFCLYVYKMSGNGEQKINATTSSR